MEKYTSLDQKGIVIAEYVWIDSEGSTRSKTRVSIYPGTSIGDRLTPALIQTLEAREDGKKWDVDTLPIWNFDGSSTGQAPSGNSDVYLRPCAVYPDPFRKGDNILCVSPLPYLPKYLGLGMECTD
jgi:glutamine synthetase